MKIVIDVRSTGIHRNATIDITNWTAEDKELVTNVAQVVENFNKQQVENA